MKKLCTIFTAVLLLCGGMNVLAQSNRFTNGTEGTDFWFSFPVCLGQTGGSNALKIYVSCEVATQCTLDIPGLGKKIVRSTKPHDVIDFTLFPGEGQPYEKDDGATGAKSEEETYAIGKGRGIHVYADAPITVYGVSRFLYTSDSFIALPVSSLGKEYIVASYADVTASFPGQHLMSQTVVVAAHDSTFVSFTLGGRQGTKTVGDMSIGQTKTFKLNKGNVVAFANKKINGVYGDISGSKIVSTKPVAVISGNQCAYVDVNTPACDFIVEMELPTHTWGREYHVTRMNKRQKYSFIKVFSKSPGTKLYRDGETEPFAVLATSGGAQNTGYYEGRVLNDSLSPRPIVIRGDEPISVTQFNPGQADDGVVSDPFQLVLTPIEQYQKEIVFNTPGVKGGQGFIVNYVNLVFEADSTGSMPDDLEFATVGNSQFQWKSVKSMFGSSAEPFKGFAGDTKKYFLKIITLPGDGVYKIRAKEPFTAYSYGYDNYDSYAHPTSLILNDASLKDTAPPAIVLKGNDSSITVGLAAQDTGIVTSNVSRIFLNPSASLNFVLKTDEFVAGQAQPVNVIAQVVNPFYDAKAEIVVVDRAGNYSLKTLSYKGKPGVLAKFWVTDLYFGAKKAGNTTESTLILENMGKEVGTITSHTNPTKNEFKLIDWPTFPLEIQPGEKITLKVSFMSLTGGVFLDSIKFTSASGSEELKLTAQLFAEAIESYLVASGYDFARALVGEKKTGFIRLRNLGNAPVQVLRVNKPSDSVFKTDFYSGEFTAQPGIAYDFPVNFVSNSPGVFKDRITFVTAQDSIISEISGIVEKPSSIERVYDPSFNISPNPATGFTTINLPLFKSQNPLLKVYDALGNQAADLTAKVNGASINFDTRILSNGAYFVRFTDGTYTLIRTFVVHN